MPGIYGGTRDAPPAPGRDTVELPHFTEPPTDRITWRHLLEQTSGWNGELWSKPAAADAQSRRPGSGPAGARPGEGWAYNDVRVNLLCLALTALLRRPCPMSSPTASWRPWLPHKHGSGTATATPSCASTVRDLPVVSGGAHWGGGLWINALDLALIGELYRRRGRWNGHELISSTWIDLSWTPSASKPDYGLLWWLNDHQTLFPTAPATGRAARGNLGRHLLWVDPVRNLVIASHWGSSLGERRRPAGLWPQQDLAPWTIAGSSSWTPTG